MLCHHFVLAICTRLWHTSHPDRQKPNRETDAFDTIICGTNRRRAAGLATERTAVRVRVRFHSADEQTRTRVSKAGLTGGRPKNPPPTRQEGRNGPGYRKKHHRPRQRSCCAGRTCPHDPRHQLSRARVRSWRGRDAPEICKCDLQGSNCFHIVNVQKKLDAALCNRLLVRDAKRNARSFETRATITPVDTRRP
jgi:hypothetical protein